MPLLGISSVFGVPPEVLSKVLLSAAILGGAVMCFFGCRLFKLALALGGLVGGAALAAYGVWRYTATPEVVAAVNTPPDILEAMIAAPRQTVILVWAASGGVTGAVLSVLMLRVGVFLLGAGLGALLVNTTMDNATVDAYLIVLAILGLIGGVLALMMTSPIVVLSTALNGALALMFGIYALLKEYSPEQAVRELQGFGQDAYVVLGCTAVLAAIGSVLQFCIMPKHEKPETVYKRVKKPKKRD